MHGMKRNRDELSQWFDVPRLQEDVGIDLQTVGLLAGQTLHFTM